MIITPDFSKSAHSANVRFGFFSEKPMSRDQVLTALENLDTYNKVFDDAISSPSPEIEKIRQALSQKKLSLNRLLK